MAKFTTRQLTKAGFASHPEKDFSDDGTRFKYFELEGIPITYAKADGEIYLAIRLDYLEGLNWEEYSKLPSYKVVDEFNGVHESRMDVEKLVENIKEVKEEVETLRTLLATKKIDKKAIIAKVAKEQEEIRDMLKDLANTKWWEAERYTIEDIAKYAVQLSRSLEVSAEDMFNAASHKDQRKLQMLLDRGQDILKTSARGFYGERVTQFITKHPNN